MSACPLAILYTKEPPSKYAVRSAILMSLYPKSNVWNMGGFPLLLRCDRGSIQKSHWLKGLEGFAERMFKRPLKISHTNEPYAPWANGHAEQLISMMHHDFERGRLQAKFGPQCYWGNKPTERPDFFKPDEGPVYVDRSDEQFLISLPTLEQVNAEVAPWVEQLLQREPSPELFRRLGMNRWMFWQIRAMQQAELVRSPERRWAEEWLMEKRESLTVHKGGMVCLEGLEFHAAELIAYEGSKVHAWFDPCNVNEVYVYPQEYGQRICVARRKGLRLVSDAMSIQQWQKERKENRAALKGLERAHIGGDAVQRRKGGVRLMKRQQPEPLRVVSKAEQLEEILERGREALHDFGRGDSSAWERLSLEEQQYVFDMERERIKQGDYGPIEAHEYMGMLIGISLYDRERMRRAFTRMLNGEVEQWSELPNYLCDRFLHEEEEAIRRGDYGAFEEFVYSQGLRVDVVFRPNAGERADNAAADVSDEDKSEVSGERTAQATPLSLNCIVSALTEDMAQEDVPLALLGG